MNTTSCKSYYDKRKRKYKIKDQATNGKNKQNKCKPTPNITRYRLGLRKRKLPVQPTKHYPTYIGEGTAYNKDHQEKHMKKNM